MPLKPDGLKTNEALNFRRVARQVMLTNVFTRRKTFAESSSITKRASSTDGRSIMKTRHKDGEESDKKSSIKRQGTPELFPMSEEMKQTVVSLGFLDLLPEEDNQLHAASQRKDGRSARNGSKFLERTKQKVIYPQRFIRSVRSSLVYSKNTVENADHCLDAEHRTKNSGDSELHDNEGDFSATENNERVSLTAKSKHNPPLKPGSLHFLRMSKPLYFSSTAQPTHVKRSPLLRPQKSLPATCSRYCGSRSKLVPTTGSVRAVQTKCWEDGESSPPVTDKINNETQARRRWKSVECLTREIENKCYTWLESRHRMGVDAQTNVP